MRTKRIYYGDAIKALSPSQLNRELANQEAEEAIDIATKAAKKLEKVERYRKIADALTAEWSLVQEALLQAEQKAARGAPEDKARLKRAQEEEKTARALAREKEKKASKWENKASELQEDARRTVIYAEKKQNLYHHYCKRTDKERLENIPPKKKLKKSTSSRKSAPRSFLEVSSLKEREEGALLLNVDGKQFAVKMEKETTTGTIYKHKRSPLAARDEAGFFGRKNNLPTDEMAVSDSDLESLFSNSLTT